MSINSINSDNRLRNNIYAGVGAAVAGAGGAIGGVHMAPRSAKTLDDLVSGSVDVFDKTMSNIRKKNLQMFNVAMQTIFPARTINNSLNAIVDKSFEGEKIPVEKVHEFIKNKEDSLKEVLTGYDKVIESYKNLDGKPFTLNDIYSDMIDNKVIKKEDLTGIKKVLVAAFGEDVLTIPVTLDDDLMKSLDNTKAQVIESGTSELNLYKKFATLEKDGVILKSDMLDTVKTEVKNVVKPVLENTSFENFKKYIPRKGAALYAMAAGFLSALAVGGAIKLFSDKKSS